MPIQNLLVSLCQEAKSQECLKSPTEMQRIMNAKQGKYGLELIEEMSKPVVTHKPVTTHKPTQIQKLLPTYYPSRRARVHHNNSYVSPSDDVDELYDWKGRQVVFTQSDGMVHIIGRRTQPGFS